MAKRLKGINLDVDPIDMPPEQYRGALNALLTKRKGAVCSDEGAELESDIAADSISLSTGLEIVGSTSVYDNTHILFATDGTNSEIGIYDGTSYSTVVSSNLLNFQTGSVVEAVSIINNSDEIVVYWTDNINPPRFYNITENPGIDNVDALRIFPTISNAPYIELNSVDSGGSLKTGAYYFGIRMVAEDDSVTSFMNLTPPVYIGSDNGDGAPSETVTGKAIHLSINNLDENYEGFEIVAIRKQDGGVAEAVLLEEQGINSDNSTTTYNGGDQGLAISFEEVVINNASYEKAKSIAEIDNTLYMGNMTQTPELDYQKFANNIKVSSTTKPIDINDTGIEGDENFANPQVSFYDKSFKRGEVYALYISFVLEGGIESQAFHIPGRASEGTEESTDDSVVTGAKEFQIFSNPGTNDMAFWENAQETYPDTDDWDIYDVDSNGDPVDTTNTLRNENVRHHHFPDNTSPFDPENDTSPVVLGLTLDDVKIPSSIIDRVRAVKLYYAKRTPLNRRILDQGIIVPVTQRLLEINGVDDDYWVYQPGEVEGPNLSDTRAGFLHGFHSFRSNQNVGSTSYVKLISQPRGDAIGTDLKTEWDQTEKVNFLSSPTYHPIFNNAITYLEKNGVTEGTNIGFSFDIYNGLGEQAVAFEVNNPMDFSHVTDNRGSGNNKSIGYVGELVAYRTELYTPFDQQQLVWTGYIETNLENFNPVSSQTGEDSFAEGEIEVLTGSNDIPDTQATATSEITAGADADGGTLVITYDGNSVNVVLSGSETIDDVGAAIETAVNGDGTITLSVSYDSGTNVLTFTADDGEEDENGKTVTIDVANTGVTVSDSSPDMAGGDSLDDLIVTLDTESITVDTPNNDTAENVAIAINDGINAQSTNYSSTINGAIISIVADSFGTEFNGNIFVTEGNTGVTTDDTDLLGGSSTSETQATFKAENVYGGDTFVSLHGTRRTGWNTAGGDPPQDPIRHVLKYVCESYDNIQLRHAGTEDWQIYYPLSTGNDINDVELDYPEEGVGVLNYIGYNIDYSTLADIKSTIPKLKDAENITNYPTRIIRSLQGDSNIGEDEGLRTFLENDFIDLSRKRGPITTLSVMDNVLIPHMERAMVRTKGREEMLVGDIRTFIGAGDIFAVNPDEILYTETGFAGLQDQRCKTVTPYGYFFIDRDAGKAFLVGESPEVISDRGLNNFFQDELSGASAGDFICTWDNKWDRIILTYKGNWTLSYYPQLKAWGSFHSFNPDYYFYGIDTFFAINGDELYKHNVEDLPCTYYGSQFNFEYEIVENRQAPATKTFANIQFITEVEDTDGDSIFNETFDQFRIFTDLQDSGTKDIIYFTDPGGNARNVEGTWKINDFRNMLVGGVVDENKPWQNQDRIRHKWAALRLIFNNTDNKSLYLYDINMGVKISRR